MVASDNGAWLRNRQQRARQQQSAPVPVVIAASALIAIKCIGLLLLFNNLGMEGVGGLISNSVLAWDTTLVFLLSMVLLAIQIGCGPAVLRGRNWGRWGYVCCQILVAVYLLLASLGWIEQQMFILPGETDSEVMWQLALEKLPDVIILSLLFVPASSRHFFLRRV